MNKSNNLKIVFLMSIGIFLCMIDTTIMNIALPAIQSDLHTTLEQMSWVLNIYTISIAVFSIPLGRVADIFGKTKIYILGLFIFGIGSLLCAFANSGELLISFRFIQSIGAAILFPTSMVIGVSSVSMEKRTKALAILGVTQGLSAALGPALGGLITEFLGWRWVFIVNIPVCILAIILCLKMLPVKNEEKLPAKIDWFGLVTSSVAITLLTVGVVKGNEWGWTSYKSIACFLGSAIFLLFFIRVERKVSAPMINLNLFKDRTFVGAAIVVVLSNIFLVGVTVILPTFLTRIQNKTELGAALLITPISAMIFVFSPLAPLFLKKLGKLLVILIGFILMAGAYYLLQHIDIHSTGKDIIIPCMLLGIGFGVLVGPVTILAASSFEGEMLTASQSVTTMLRQVGIVLAVAIFVSSLNHNIKESKGNIRQYAQEQVDKIGLDKSDKSKILKKVNADINSESIKVQKKGSEVTLNSYVSDKQREAIINKQVSSALNSIPEEYKENQKNDITEQVTKKVDNNLKHIQLEISNTSKNIHDYSETEITASFNKLYKYSIPFILVCSLFSLVFIEKRRKSNTVKKVLEDTQV
ncbi:DHA2 family efflux MFS transporter permease subunit [Priestia megaterium]|uniref:MFS transporter n=1 Tax=Priestia megaterium TaxID=1404 RepID=UPI0030C97DF3